MSAAETRPDLRRAYRESGVDVAAGDRAVELIRQRLGGGALAAGLPGIGGFAAAVPLPAGLREPVLVSATDGVGTKTALAARMGRYDTIGRDLVAMCADDVVCLGARPLFMLDYVAVGRVDPQAVSEIVGGVADGCEEARCALVGGETAEHPGLMEAEQFDLAGFCVGVVERSDLLDGTQATEGDVLVGLASSGLHANGYSLVRQLLAEHDIPLDRPFVECVQASLGERAAAEMVEQEPEHLFATLGDVLLAPSRIYARTVLDLRDLPEGEGAGLHGLAHVTGGGLPGNVARALPEGLAAVVDPRAWRVPTVFRFLQALGGLEEDELRATLNCGIGMVAVLAPSIADRAAAFLLDRGVPSWPIGHVEPVSVPGGARYVESLG